MKTILFASFLFFSSLAFAQQDSSRVGGKIPLQSDSTQIDTMGMKAFIDQNGNGIDDRLERGKQGKGKHRRMDQFKDADGDGICDGKESSTGIKKLRWRRMKRGK